MIRTLVIAAGAATLLGACTVSSNDPYPSGRGTYYNPPGYVDLDGNRRDDRVQGDRNRSGYRGGYYDRWGNWHSYR
ncbi:MAG: hypothetical protein AB7O88_19150 [Reyranellaceae bacterium]